MARGLSSLEGKIETIVLADVQTDPAYQRGLKGHRKFIKENFDPAAAGVLTVARRADNSLWWLDGQQRADAMKDLNIAKWRATVLESSGQRYEAHIFRLLNDKKGRRGLNARELFTAALTEEDPVALSVKRAVEANGLKLGLWVTGGTGGWPWVGCVGLLYRMCAAKGEDVLKSALELAVATWPDQDDMTHESVVGAVITLVSARGDVLDREVFKGTLRKTAPRTLMNKAVMLSSGTSRYGAVADVMIMAYNKKVRGVKKLRLFTVAADVPAVPHKDVLEA